MKAGKLQHLVTIQKYTATRDATGGEIKAWATHVERWAWIKPLTGSEKYINQQMVAQVTHNVSMRYTPGVTPGMRLLLGDRVLEIVAPPINVDERNIETRLLCKELL